MALSQPMAPRSRGHAHADVRPATCGLSFERAARTLYAALLACAVVVAALSFALRPDEPRPAAWTRVSVGESTTLWDIAEAHSVEGLSTLETLRLIQEANGLTSSLVARGQTLRVPCGSPQERVADRRGASDPPR